MKILCDFHHSSLYSSYLYTLEARLGHSVYRQIGEKWFTEGFWKINRQKDTIAQYLATYGYQPVDGTPSLNQVQWVQDGIYYSKDPNTGQIHKAITFDTFMAMDFDVVIASIPQHIAPFMELARRKNAKFVFQVGNEFDFDYNSVPNLMASIMPRDIKTHHVFYHQEFDTNAFSPAPPVKNKTISNFMNVLRNYPFANKWFLDLEDEMMDYDFNMYGSQNRDGCLTGVQNIANAIKSSRWIFHVKPGGDGYGHCLHNAFACGVPLIVNKRLYEGKLAGRMMNDKTCIIIDGMTPKQAAEYIRNQEQRHDEMSKEVYTTFTSLVDFDKDAKKIQTFLEELV